MLCVVCIRLCTVCTRAAGASPVVARLREACARRGAQRSAQARVQRSATTGIC
jgi:hypothetical protein